MAGARRETESRGGNVKNSPGAPERILAEKPERGEPREKTQCTR